MAASDFRKCLRNERQEADRISSLPDDILVDILSSLTLADAARTSVLSKRWTGLWMNLAGLDLDAPKMGQGIYEISELRRKYTEWVNKVVQSHKSIRLDFFRIAFDLGDSSRGEIDKWIQYALARRVQSLDLNLLPYCRPVLGNRGLSYAITPNILAYPSSSSYSINSDARSGLKFLRALRFNNVDVPDSVVQFVLQNCPLLEHLAVVGSGYLKEVKLCDPSLALKHLAIIGCWNLHSLTLCDTNIVSLKVSHGGKLVLKNAPNLVDVFIGDPTGMPRGALVERTISWLSCCLSKLEVLTLKISNCQADWERKEVAGPQLTRLKQLTFVMSAPHDFSLIPFTSLMRLCPNLEKFALKSGGRRLSHRLYRYLRCSHEIVSVASPLNHLKVVEIGGYCGHEEREVGLIKYLVENGGVLERIIIDPCDQMLGDFPTVVERNRERLQEEEALCRDFAKEQLRSLVPSQIELIVL